MRIFVLLDRSLPPLSSVRGVFASLEDVFAAQPPEDLVVHEREMNLLSAEFEGFIEVYWLKILQTPTYGRCDTCGETMAGNDPDVSRMGDGRDLCVYCGPWQAPVGPRRQAIRARRDTRARHSVRKETK